MISPRSHLLVLLLGACLVFGGGAALAQGLEATMLARLEPGLWALRMRDGGVAERICLGDGRRLIQLRHPNTACRQFVVQDDADEVTIHYACPGRGYGRTHLRRESSRLVQIESQGIADKLPFEFAAEARRIGNCG